MVASGHDDDVRTAAPATGRERERVSRPPHRLPPGAMLPTLCTMGNLLAGFAAIHYAALQPEERVLWNTWSPLTFAGALIFLGIVLDAFDGMLARLTRSNSEIGAQLDSLADVVTCGIAPAFLAIRLLQSLFGDVGAEHWLIGPAAETFFGKLAWGAAAIYVCCAALRLARFNAEIDDDSTSDRDSFRGLPSPGAAGVIASLAIVHQHLTIVRFDEQPPPLFVEWSSIIMLLILLVCALAMISSLPYVHVSNTYLQRPRSPQYFFRLIILLTLAVLWFQEVLAIGMTIYLLSGPFKAARQKLKRRPRSLPTSGE